MKKFYLFIILFACLQTNLVATSTGEFGSIIVHSIDEKNNPIQGVQFQLYDSNDILLEQTISDKDGYASFTNLKYGKYTIEQKVTPTLYKNNSNQWELNLSKQNKSRLVNNPLKYNKSGSISVWNLDSTRKGIPGFSYGIYDESGDLVQKITTDSSGEAQSSNLKYGTYYLKQVETPANYELDENTYQLEISNQYSEVSLIKENIRNSFTISFTILDEDGSGVQNVSYDLVKKGNVIKSSISNSNGVVTFSNVEPGNYTITPSNESILESFTVNVSKDGVISGNPLKIYLPAENISFISENQNNVQISTENNNQFSLNSSSEFKELVTSGQNLMYFVSLLVLVVISLFTISMVKKGINHDK